MPAGTREYISVSKTTKQRLSELEILAQSNVSNAFNDIEISTSLTCKEVRCLICSEGLKRCFEGYVSPRNGLFIGFDLRSHLDPKQSVANKSHLVLAQSILTLVVYKLYYVLLLEFSLGTNQSSFDRS